VEGLIDTYGQNPSMVPALLQFLTVLPEELYSNTKIPVTVRFRRNSTEPVEVVVNFVSPF
jgi:hypothetical protein